MYKTLLLSMVLVGCGETPEEDDNVPVAEGKEDAFSFLPAPGDTAPWIYFDNGELATLEAPRYWRFTAKDSHNFTIEEQALKSGIADTKAKVGFKLYRLARSNHYNWKLIGQADSKKGLASLTYKGKDSHYYLLEVSAGKFPTDVSVKMTCAGGDHSVCAYGGQPHDKCGTSAATASIGWCGNGLDCQCGECGLPGSRVGSCNCEDENQFEDSTAVVPAGTYVFVDDAGNHYTYTFDNGKLTSIREPACRFVQPFCAVATFQKKGSYTVNGDDTLSLTYEDGSVATLITQTNCRGTDRIAGDDYGTRLILTHAN